MSELEFFFNGLDVGCFEESEYPRSAGTYRYTPYRGEGHYQMQEEIKDDKFPRCYYDVGDASVFFTVIDCPEPGALELASFERIRKAK